LHIPHVSSWRRCGAQMQLQRELKIVFSRWNYNGGPTVSDDRIII